jgi:hypothetical protein
MVSVDRLGVYCYCYGPNFVFVSFLIPVVFFFFVCFVGFYGLCVSMLELYRRRLYRVGPSSPEGAQLNVRGGGFLLYGLEHLVLVLFLFCNLCLSMLVFMNDLYLT